MFAIIAFSAASEVVCRSQMPMPFVVRVFSDQVAEVLAMVVLITCPHVRHGSKTLVNVLLIVVLRYIKEAALFKAVCFLLGVLLAWAFTPLFNSILDTKISLFSLPVVWGCLLVAYLVISLLSGLFSAIVPSIIPISSPEVSSSVWQIARAVVGKPSIILADEPTGNLDSKNGMEVMLLLSELNEEGTTIVMVTHSKHDATYASRIINLFDGQVVDAVNEQI